MALTAICLSLGPGQCADSAQWCCSSQRHKQSEAAERGHAPQEFHPPSGMGDQLGHGLERAYEEVMGLNGASGGEEGQEWCEVTHEERAQGAKQKVLLEKVNI